MDKNSSLRRLKRLFKLTGDFGWMGKYAEQAENPKGYKMPTIEDFVFTLQQANAMGIDGAEKQSTYGKLAANALADFYDKKLDVSEPAFATLEFKNNHNEGLSKSLVAFSKDERAALIQSIRGKIAKLGDAHLKADAQNLSDDHVFGLIGFALIRGYIQAYNLFLIKNPIVSLMTLSEMPEKKVSFPVTLKSILKLGAEPKEEEETFGLGSEQITSRLDKIQSDNPLVSEDEWGEILDYEQVDVLRDEDAGYEAGAINNLDINTRFEIADLLEALDRVQSKRESIENEEEVSRDIAEYPELSEKILKSNESAVTLSQLKNTFKLIRLENMKALQSSPDDQALRMHYLSSDAIVTYLGNMQKAIKAFIKANPRNQYRMFYGQPIRGLDGKGDIIVTTPDGLEKLHKISIESLVGELNEGQGLEGVGAMLIPWTDVDGETINFDTGRGDGSAAQKYVGRTIPLSGQILDMYIVDKYRDGVDEDGNIVSGIELSKKEMMSALHEDSKLAVEYARSNMGSIGAGSEVSDVLEYMVLSTDIAKEQIPDYVAKLYNAFLNITEKVLTELDVVEFGQTGVEKITEAFLAALPGLAELRLGWESSSSVLVDKLLGQTGLVRNPVRSADTFNRGIDTVLLQSKQAQSRESRFLKINKTLGNKAANTILDNIRAKGNVVSKADEKEIKKTEVARSTKLASDIMVDIDSTLEKIVFEVDEKIGYVHPGVRDSSNYKAKLYDDSDSLLNMLVSKYADQLPRNKKGEPDKNYVQTIIEASGNDIFPAAMTAMGGRGVHQTIWSGRGTAASGIRQIDFTKPVRENGKNTGQPPRWFNIGVALKQSLPFELYQELIQFVKENQRPFALPQDLGAKVKAALGDAQYAPKRGGKNPETVNIYNDLLSILKNEGSEVSFQSMVTKRSKEILSSDWGKNPEWKTQFKDSLKMSGDIGREAAVGEHEKSVMDWYNQISHKLENEEFLNFPQSILEFKRNGAKPFMHKPGRRKPKAQGGGWYGNEPGSPEEVSYEESLTEIRQWMAKHRGPPGNPHGGVRPLLEEMFPDQQFTFEMAQGLFAYLGQAIQDIMKQKLITIRVDRDKDGRGGTEEHVTMVDLKIFRKFNAPLERGLGASSSVSSQVPDPEAVGLQQVRDFTDDEFYGNFFKSTITRHNHPYEIKLKKEKGIDHKKPHLALSSSYSGGFVQQMMGYSLSEGLGTKLTENHWFEHWFGVNARESFGNKIRKHVNTSLTQLWSPQINPYSGMIESPAKYESKREFMEKVGAFADPIWSFSRFTKAFGAQEEGKIQRGFIKNEPDTAENHFLRVAYHSPQLDPEGAEGAIRGLLTARAEKIKKEDFSNLKENIVDTYLIIRYKEEEHSQTNSPFAKWTPEQMFKFFRSNGMSNENVEDLFGNMKRAQDRREELGISDDLNDIPEADEAEDIDTLLQEKLGERELYDYFKVTNIAQAKNFFLGAANQFDAQYDQIKPDIREAGEAAFEKLSSMLLVNGQIDSNKNNEIFSSHQSWRETAEFIITTLPHKDDKREMAKSVMLVLLKRSDDEVQSFDAISQNIVVMQENYNESIQNPEEEIEAIEEDVKEEVDQGDFEAARESLEEIDQVEEEAPSFVPETPGVPEAVEPGVPAPEEAAAPVAPEQQQQQQPAPQESEEDELARLTREQDDDENKKFSSLVFRSDPSNEPLTKDIWEEGDRIFFE